MAARRTLHQSGEPAPERQERVLARSRRGAEIDGGIRLGKDGQDAPVVEHLDGIAEGVPYIDDALAQAIRSLYWVLAQAQSSATSRCKGRGPAASNAHPS
jgi:hypothetical protein